MSELKPCTNSALQHPAAEHLIVKSYRGPDSGVGPFFVGCRYCFCQGPHAETKQAAIAAWNALPRTVQAAPSDDKPADPYSGELGAINLRLLSRKMLWVLRYLKRQGVYHPAMDDLLKEGTMHGLGLEGPIPDPDPSSQAAPSDREKRLEAALRELRSCIKRDVYMNGRQGTPVVSIGARFERAWEESVAALADTTNSDGGES